MALSWRIAGRSFSRILRSGSSLMAGGDPDFRRVVRRNEGDAPYLKEPPVAQGNTVYAMHVT